jgi:hypothetical protein
MLRCAPSYNEMTIAVSNLHASLGTWAQPDLVALVLYAPRPPNAPMPTVLFTEPGWNPTRDERRIVAWDGSDRMLFTVGWPLGTITEVRVQAVVATGRCGSERTVLAEGEVRGLQWSSSSDPGGTIVMQPRREPIWVEGEVTGESCQ